MHTTIATTRDIDLRQMLCGRRRELQEGVYHRLHDVRADQSREVVDDVERCDAATHGEIEFALLQMKAETLTRIDTALVQLAAGLYGRCFECDAEISRERLRALPFAVRCKGCEERREQEQRQTRQAAQTRGPFSRFSDVISS